MMSAEARLNEALGKVNDLTEENKQLKVAVTEQRLRAARAERELRFREANLSGASKARLHDAFKNSTDNAGLHEAIKVELRRGVQ